MVSGRLLESSEEVVLCDVAVAIEVKESKGVEEVVVETAKYEVGFRSV